jgi:serine/threonine protein kinase
MNAMRICSVCSKPLAANAPQGLCPECLLKAGLGTGVDIGLDSQSRAESGKVPFVAPTPEELAKPFPQLEILSFIGQGGMGAVYKARQKALDRVVALKILPPGIGKDPAFAERFTREARALAKLNHPGIVTLYEFGQADGLFFFLMEFVDGVNLRQLLEAGRLSPREALAIVPQICDALQYAHDQGIVHRDIKPENILLDRQGRVKVADFGLAKLVGTEGESSADGGVAAGSVVLTEAGKVMGTPQYMAPEQMGTPATVDHRADIYSLGVVFYQMLTGELPGKRIEPPSRKVQVDVRIDEIVLRALEKTPELRYQTAADFRTQIETVVNDAGTASPANRTDNSAPRRLNVGTSLVTTPEQLGTFDGQFFLYRRKSQMLLEDRQLTFARGGTTTVIPLAVIRDLSIGHYPRTMHPAGLDFISVTYDDGGQTKRLFFSPYESWFGLPSHFNQFVAEWFAAIRAAVVAATGREPGNTPAEQLGVPSGSKVIYALLLAPVILCDTFLLAGVLAGVVMRLRAGDAATHSFLGALLVIILLGVLGFGLLALALRRLSGRSRKPAAPPHLSRTAVVALLLSLGGCVLSLLLGLVVFQSWGWVFGSFFAIEIAAMILGIVAWDNRAGKAAVILSFALMLAWIPGTLTHVAQVAPNRLPRESPRNTAATVKFVARFPQGTVELVALSWHPSVTNQPWWRPDGSISSESFGGPVTRESWSSGKEMREIGFRIRGGTNIGSSPILEFDAMSGVNGQGPIVYRETPDAPYTTIVEPFACPPGMKKTNIRVRDASGRWKVEFRNVSLELGYKTQVKVVDAAEDSGSTSAATSALGPSIKNAISGVHCDSGKATIEYEIDDAHELFLFVGAGSRGWSVWYTGTTSAIATVEASDQIKMEDGSLGRGFIFQVKGTRHYIAITPDGPVPFGELVFREDANVTENEGTFTFADIRQSDGTLIPVSIRVRPRPAAAGVSSNSAAQIARLKLEQAQAVLVRAKASYDTGTASLTEYQTARLAKDIAEAELSGDTAAILRARLQFAQEQLLQAESRFEAGWATQAEVEKAKLAKDLAEAQVSGDATAIARTELQFAQQEFLEVEARYKAGVATQAEFEKAKAARDTAQAELGTAAEPPTLRFLAWQDENPSWRDWKAWRPNGERADTKDEQGLLLHHPPTRIDLSATKEGRGVRVLFVWLSHPDIQRRTYAEMTMADSTGRTIPPCLDGYGGTIHPAKASEGELGWVVRWFAPAQDATLPSMVNLTLRYSLGDWQFPLMVTRGMFGGTMETEWGNIPGAGETLDGKAFVSLVRNPAKGRALQVDFVAETTDGRLIEPSGTLESGPPEMRHGRFQFDVPLGQIKEFRLRTCPIRTVEYRNVSLQAGHSAEVQVSPVSSSQPAAFGPVIERVIAMPDADDQGLVFFDMETGKSFKPPFPLTFHPNQGPAFVELTPELSQWIKARDMDILLHLGEKTWDMMTLEMQEGFAGQFNEWETISPEKVIAVFAQKDADHLVRDEVPASSFGNSYRDEFGSFNAFRTRSDTMGVYQFEGVDNTTRRGVGMRYKLVQATGSTSAATQTNASKTFSLRYMLASEMADDLRQILLGRFGMEARPALDNMQLTVMAPPDVLNRVSTFVTVVDWPNRIAPGPDSYYPRENVELAARSFFYACSIEDADGVALMLSPGVLAELRGTSLTAHGVLGEEKDAELVRQLRGDWPGKEAAVQGVIQAWNRFPLQRLWAEPGVAIGFGIRYFATAWFEGSPEERMQLSFIPDRTGGTNGPLLIDTLPPWLSASPEREPTRTKPTPGAVLPTTDSNSVRLGAESGRIVVDHSGKRLSADRIELTTSGQLQVDGSAAFAISGSQANGDMYSSVSAHVFFCQGKPRDGLKGWEQGWKVEDGCLVNAADVARISTEMRFGKEDLIVSASLSLDEVDGTGMAFTFGDGYTFEFGRTDQRLIVNGPTLLRSYQHASAANTIAPGKPLLFVAKRRGPLIDFLINDKLVYSVQYEGEIGTVGFAPRRGAIRIRSFGVSQMWPFPTQ